MEFKIFVLSLALVNNVYGQHLRSEYTVDMRSAFNQDLYESVLDPDQCNQQLTFLRENPLGFQFIDASGKIPNGILAGNVNDLGDYFQCLAIDEVVNEMEIQGKYCALQVLIENPIVNIPTLPEFPEIIWPTTPDGGETGGEDIDGEITYGRNAPSPEQEAVIVAQKYQGLTEYALGISGFGEPVENRIFPMLITSRQRSVLGVCIPKVCTATQAIDYFQEQAVILNFTYSEYFCRLPNDKPLSGSDYTAIVIFSILGCLLVVSTSYDLYVTFFVKGRSSSHLLRCFSVYTNTRRFLTFNTVPGALECVDGIRAISMLWVVVGHTYSFTLLGFIHNLTETIAWLTKFSSVWINSAPITVDTFFLLSGILVVYTTVGKISQGRFIRTIHLFCINRLMRMFPLLATVVLLQASLINHMSDGPFWLNVAQQVENCRTWWWAALLHVQNYVNAVETCLPQSWYLSVDVQLYFFCPIVMVWMFDREFISWIVLVGIVLLSLTSSTIYSFLYNFTAALANPVRLGEFSQYLTIYYFNTLTRAPPFFIGMVYGYLLHIYRNKEFRISKLNLSILWLFSFAMMAFCIFSMYPVMQPNHQGQFFDNFLNAYMRAIWACALGWLIFACVHGYGGPINWFLSLQMWKLPARLSFAMYLVHVSIIMVANGSWTKTHYFSEGDNMYRFFSDVTITFIAAFILCVCVDAPFSTLQKMLMGGGKRPQKPKSESRNNIVEDEPTIVKTSL